MDLPRIETDPGVRALVRKALDEDLGEAGDTTTLALVPEDGVAAARIVSRAGSVLSGVGVAALVFRTLDHGVACAPEARDGIVLAAGDVVMTLQGRARSILTGERTALNFLQRMSGIASLTRRFVESVAAHGTQILDTRKTMPGARVLDKYAVLCGGGANHRMGLYDRILIKDNHRAFWAGVGAGLDGAVTAAREAYPGLVVEIEVESEEDLETVLRAAPDWVLLDNMPPARLRRCVEICAGRCKVEASGGITLENVADIAATGVDAVSLGCLTHSPSAADFSLELG
jgi:nicotinate-nucleotide pyrophosphorylase (carboxylating)